MDAPASFRRFLPAFAVALWLAFVAWAIWQHVQTSGQPLIYDAITYWLKARNVWAHIAQGHWANPFNVDPTVRPPGTVLMSYPFGFEESPKGFLFRSVFLGIALTAAAVFFAARTLPSTAARRMDVAFIALFLCALPLFYHFEWSSNSRWAGHWGLTDGFLAGLAALAGSAAMLGAVKESWQWTFAAALLASLCFLTKPAGALIVVTVACCWLVIALAVARASRAGRETQTPYWHTLRVGLTVFGIVYGPVLFAGRHSDYFSRGNIDFGSRALKVMKEAWLAPTPSDFELAIRLSFGYAFAVAVVAAVVAGVVRLRLAGGVVGRAKQALAASGLVAAIVYCASGGWFWLIQTGGSQIRYFYPFALMAAISILPLALLALDAASRRTRVLIRVLLLLPTLNVTILLALPEPPVMWQRISGVNLAAGPAGPDVLLGRGLLDAVRLQGQGTSLYAASSDDTAAIESLWEFEGLAHPDLPNVRVKRPFDWQRPTTVRLAEINDAEFILFPIVSDRLERERRLTIALVDNYGAEQRLFEGWFSSLGEKDGAQLFAETDKLRLLRVVEPRRLELALDELRRTRQWNLDFLAANPQTWWSKDEISARFTGRKVASADVDFGGLFRVEALFLEREGDGIHVDFWWERKRAPLPGGWFFFAHLIDDTGATIANVGVQLSDRGSYAVARPFRFESLTVPLPAGATPKAIAFGIYRAEASRADTLVADRGNRDWDNHRVVVPLP